MRSLFGRPIRWAFRQIGYDLRRARRPGEPPAPQPDFEPDEIEIIHRVLPHTMTGGERIVSLIRAIHYIADQRIPGDIVECGVWRGGSMMTAVLALQSRNDTTRDLWLYDTFEGMSPPTAHDRTYDDRTAEAVLEKQARWLTAPLQGVREVIASTGYNMSRVHFVKGKVEDTIPESIPNRIALLRLDTDWYESTIHELVHLYPRLEVGGVIIIDDYGHWRGARLATDEYLEANRIPLLLNRIDYTARIGVKLRP